MLPQEQGKQKKKQQLLKKEQQEAVEEKEVGRRQYHEKEEEGQHEIAGAVLCEGKVGWSTGPRASSWQTGLPPME